MEKSKTDKVFIIIAVVAMLCCVGFCFKGFSFGGASNSTPEGAAQTFINALTTGNTKAMEEINHSEAFLNPPQTCFETAQEWGWTGMNAKNDFTYEQENEYMVKVTCTKDQRVVHIKLLKLNGKYYFSEW